MHILLLITLVRCVKNSNNQISIKLIYEEYSQYAITFNTVKLDQINVKKLLREMHNSNLIYINEKKFPESYELVKPIEEIIDLIYKMNGISYKLDSDMKIWMQS